MGLIIISISKHSNILELRRRIISISKDSNIPRFKRRRKFSGGLGMVASEQFYAARPPFAAL